MNGLIYYGHRFTNQGIKKCVMLVAMVMLSCMTQAQQVSLDWARSIGGAWWDEANTIVPDGQGNHYVIGSYLNTVDFDPGPGVYNMYSRTVSGFVLKLDADGKFIWAVSTGVQPGGKDKSAAVDASGHLYITGAFYNTVDVDPSAATYNLVSNGLTDMFVLKLDSNGQFVWAHSIGGKRYEFCKSIAFDQYQNIYMVGNYSDTVDFDPDTGVYELISETNSLGSSYDAFILKMDSSGKFMWAGSVGGPQADYANSVAVDTAGNAYIAGTYRETADFNPGGWVNNMSSRLWSQDVFVLKLDSAGNYVWAKSMGGTTSGDDSHSIALDRFGNVYTIGEFRGTADFDPSGSTANITSGGSSDSFIQKMDASGNYIWAKSIRGSNSNYGLSITTDNAGNVYGAGNFYSSADFDPSSAVQTINGVGTEAYILKLDAGGNYVWAQSMGGNNSDIAYGVMTDAKDDVYITGIFKDTADFAPDTATSELISNGNYDVFVMKLHQCQSTSVDVITACDTYTWIDGVTYTVSNNTAKDTLINAEGCDSIVTLDLTINYSNSSIDTVVACDAFTWIDGVTYTTSTNVITDTLMNATGCDSVITLNLTVHNSNAVIDTIAACGSYTWINGVTYTASNNAAKDTLTNILGCDSIVTLDLTIHQPTSFIDTVEACDAFTWIDGITYTSNTDTATFTLTNAHGCDSLVSLDLTILHSDAIGDTVTACQSYTWINGVTYTASTDNARYTLTNAAGCDSVITLYLILKKVNTGITVNEPELEAKSSSASAYQWLDCDQNYAVIPGETNKTFRPATNGLYSVEVTQNGCVDTSECVAINTVGITQQTQLSEYLLYPNPTRGQVYLKAQQSGTYEIEVLDITGKIVERRLTSLHSGDPQSLDLGNMDSGLYFFRVLKQGALVKATRLVIE